MEVAHRRGDAADAVGTPHGPTLDGAAERCSPCALWLCDLSRLPEGLRNTAAAVEFGALPFASLYLTDVEFAAEFSNHTLHGVLHVVWVQESVGHYRGQMAVYVKTRGLLGKAYKALVMPFRRWVLYPAILRHIERAWSSRAARSSGRGVRE